MSRLELFPRWSRPAVALASNALRSSPLGTRTRVPRGALYCRALAGESDYNICINSDMTVSCNCRDFDGSGHIGDLAHQTLAEVFEGSIAARFQTRLYESVLPTKVCSICPELARIPAHMAGGGPVTCRVPTQGIMVENTARCNLSCHLCDREGLLKRRRQSSLSLEDVDEIARTLADHGVGRVCYFNLGEPFASGAILEEMRVMRTHLPNARIITSTNGVLLDRDGAMEAALMMDYVFFSIDGVDQQTLSRYQRGGDFDRSLANMRRLLTERAGGGRIAEGHALPIVEWKYVLFRWNDRAAHMRRALELAETVGVDRLTFVPGEASVWAMSTRYHTDRILTERGQRTDAGVTFDFTDVPEGLL